MQEIHRTRSRTPWVRAAALAAAALAGVAGPAAAQTCTTANTVTAHVVALDQFIWYNRLGAHDPAAMIFALRQDVVSTSSSDTTLQPGHVRLRPGKRPRPLVLRVHENGCLNIHFQNLLDSSPGRDQPWTRAASVHVMGFQLRTSITDDGSWVRTNTNSLAVNPGDSRSYYLLAPKEGTYLMYSTGVTTGNEADGGSLSRGLFGAVNVEPAGSRWYRSQVSNADLRLAQRKDAWNFPVNTPGMQPVINYDAVYPGSHPLAGRPILRMVDANGVLQHGDLTAIIAAPAGSVIGPVGSGEGLSSGEGISEEGGEEEAEGKEGVDSLSATRRPDPSFREMTIVFHDEVGLVQAFNPVFENDTFVHTLHSGRDAFAVNYGTAGIGAEVLANRFEVGPMWRCNDCKYEEFFLSSWAVGDPAMVVDVPADFDGNGDGRPDTGPKATVAFFPEDPSNVYHSYLNDRLKIRNVHAGPKEHHIFHLHAHQWLHTPDSNGSSYLDSQAIGPGGGYTYDIFHGGSGNLNRTIGDNIFHCHFYPHFAQGMWALWRVHDVFESGSTLGNDGRPVAGSRALPDGEIAAGTPIPAVIPIPSIALAPVPSSNNPGFPFYIPGVAGHRPPPPPMDFAPDGSGGYVDGGLHRHVVTGGVAVAPPLNRFDFSKDDVTLFGNPLPETGTPDEVAAMNFHATPAHSTWRFNEAGTISSAKFFTNGRPPQPGAPFADPCPVNADPRTYLAASIQITARYNKAGWFFPQHRMFSLWDDIADFVSHARAPEPLFFRAQSNECIEYHLVNLVPKEYAMDDFQVQSPTDIIGQHIHLVKFDVTSSDGAANGFNYEDGALSYEDVQARIAAIRLAYGCDDKNPPAPNGTWPCLVVRNHPQLGVPGAQQNIQRWYADSFLGGRTLRTVFSHDHFGPSTHQQTGLYAGLIVEPTNSVWRHPDSGVIFGNRYDGGPTSWRADILQGDSSFREFNLQVADFSHAYRDSVSLTWTNAHAKLAINPPGRREVGLPYLVARPDRCPTENNAVYLPLPCPELVSADDPGTMLVNYRNEPLALRVRDPDSNTQTPGIPGDLGMAFSSRITRDDPSLTGHPWYPALTPGLGARDPYTPLLRAVEDDSVVINVLIGAHEENHNFSLQGLEWLFEPKDRASGYRSAQTTGISEHFEIELPPLFNLSGDPTDYLYQGGAATDDLWNGIWGIIRSYRYPKFTTNDLEKQGIVPDDPPLALPNNTDGATAVSEVEAEALASSLMTPSAKAADPVDRFTGHTPASAEAELVKSDLSSSSPPLLGPDNGYGGKTRVWNSGTNTWTTVTPTAPVAGFAEADPAVTGTGLPTLPNSVGGGFSGMCPREAPVREFDVSAITASTALPGGVLKYNTRDGSSTPTGPGGPLVDPSAILYVYSADLSLVSGVWKLNAGVPVEPLVLRAAAGDCVVVRMRNRLALPLLDPDGYNTLPMVVDSFNANQVRPSAYIGLNPELVQYDPLHSDAAEVGNNPRTVVAPGTTRDFQWYAGQVVLEGNALRAFPVEYGVTALTSPDRIQHPNKGAIAALVVEPYQSAWVTDPTSRNQATVYRASDGVRMFREFVAQYQDDVNLRFGSSVTLPVNDGSCLSSVDVAVWWACKLAGGVQTQPFSAGDAVPNTAEAEDSEDSGQKAFNYRTEPMWFRKGFAPNAALTFTRKLPLADVLTDAFGVPQTPQFSAFVGEHVRMRAVHSGGHGRNHTFQMHGHVWEELPWSADSRQIFTRGASEWKGAQDLLGPKSHFNFVLKNGAGGRFGVTGQYLYRDQPSFQFDGGLWGTMRVIRRRWCYNAQGQLLMPEYGTEAEAEAKAAYCLTPASDTETLEQESTGQ